MIPKVIHYCWFGRGKMPKLALMCIESWKKYLPEYEIKEWNEDNFNIDLYPYAREAYDNRKFAFVADVVRLYALYHEGGIYMDTDVEVLKSLNPFLSHHAFSGFETERSISTGLLASEKGGKWVKDNLDNYSNRHFLREDGSMDMTTNVTTITNYMLSKGFHPNNTYQDFPGLITIYPNDYFCPKDYRTEKICITDNTVVIHHYDASWVKKSLKFQRKFKRIVKSIIGNRLSEFIVKLKRLR